MVRVPLPMAEVWAQMQAQLEELIGQAGLQILHAILEEEVSRRVAPPHRPNPRAGCVRWGKQPGRSFRGTGGPRGTTTGANTGRSGSGTGELRPVTARRKNAASGAGRCGGWAVHAELSARGPECPGRLGDRQEQREPTICRRERQSVASVVRETLGRTESRGPDDRWDSLGRPGAGRGSGHWRRRREAHFGGVAICGRHRPNAKALLGQCQPLVAEYPSQ